MKYGGGFRFLVALVFVGIIAALTAGAYAAGFAAGAGSNASVSPWVSGGFAGLGSVLGLIVTIFVLVMIVRVMAFAFWGHSRRSWNRGPGGSVGLDGAPFGGPRFHHGWRHSGWQSARQEAFDEWHRQSHERSSGQVPGAPSGGAAAG